MATDPGTPDRPLAAFAPSADSPPDDRIPVRTPEARIGQGPQNDVVLDDDTVSTQHARLEFVAGGWKLTDLESTNGTFVDGVRLAPGVPTALLTHTEVAFGAYRLLFLPDPDADPEAAAVPGSAEPAPLAQRTAFRLPVWLLVLILLMLALLVTLLVVFGGSPQPAEPVVDPVTAMGAAFLSPITA